MKSLRLSDSEWTLMNALWDHAPCTITQLVALLQEETGWTKHTVITMLTRLGAKGAVRYDEGERAKQFYPVIDRADTQRQETWYRPEAVSICIFAQGMRRSGLGRMTAFL